MHTQWTAHPVSWILVVALVTPTSWLLQLLGAKAMGLKYMIKDITMPLSS
jgi:hypothetical protein